MKDIYKKIGGAVVIGAVLMTPLVNAQTLKISHVRPQESTADNDIKALAQNLKPAGIDMTIFAANALGDYTVVQERVSLGAIDMALQPSAAANDRRFQILGLPNLFSNWGEARKGFSKGSPLRKAAEDLFAKQDIRLLAVYPVYFGGIALNKPPVEPTKVDAKKGLKLRVPPIKSYQLQGNAYGYISTPLPFSEAFTAVQTGVVDGVLGSGAEGYYSSFRDVTKYYIAANTHFETWYLIMNSEKYNDLNDKQKSAIDKAVQEFEDNRWKSAESDQGMNEKKLESAGAQLIYLNDDELAEHAKKVRETVWPEIVKDIGEDFAQPILDAVSK